VSLPRPSPGVPSGDALLQVFLDFDGTLVDPNVAILLVERFCPDGPRLAHEVDELLHNGTITLREAWRRQVELLREEQIPAMAAWVAENIPFREGAPELLALLKTRNVPTTIVSGGLDFYIQPILDRAGIDLPVLCDSAIVADGGRLEVTHPYGHPTCRLCGICKANVVRRVGTAVPRTVFVGDGSTDRYAAEVADIVFARRRLVLYCERAGIPFYRFEGFAPVTHQLERWLSGAEPLPPPRRVGLASSACPISQAAAAEA